MGMTAPTWILPMGCSLSGVDYTRFIIPWGHNSCQKTCSSVCSFPWTAFHILPGTCFSMISPRDATFFGAHSPAGHRVLLDLQGGYLLHSMGFKAQPALPWSSPWAVGEPLLQHLDHLLFLFHWYWYLLLLSHLLTAAAQLSYIHFPRAATGTADDLGSGWLELDLSDKRQQFTEDMLAASPPYQSHAT